MQNSKFKMQRTGGKGHREAAVRTARVRVSPFAFCILHFALLWLALPATASAQRGPFYSAVVAFYRSSPGLYGDEGPQLTAQLAAMSTALDRWDQEIGEAERDLRSRLQSADDIQTKLQIHTTLASLYIERGRMRDAAREFDEDITLDPRRAAFHRLKGLVLQAASRHADAGSGGGRSADADRLASTASRVAEQPDVAEAADAFRMAWLLEPGDPQNAYRLIAHRSAGTTAQEIERARDTLANLERRLIRREQAGISAPFTNVSGITDDAGGGMAFVPAAYATGFSLILQNELDRGVAGLRLAIASDPLVTDPASRSESMVRGIAALREGAVAPAIEHLEAAVAAATDSSEAHRMLATANAIAGDATSSVQHLRDAIRLNPRDERSRLALAQTLAAVGRSADADDVLRTAVAELPDAIALRWWLSTRSQARQDDDDRALIDMADRLVLLVGKGELYRALAGLAQLHLDDATAIGLLERAVRMTPNNAAAHKALARAYVENGHEVEGYAELVIALLLDPGDVETLTALGRWHLTAEQSAPAVDALERAVGIDPGNRLAVHALAGALMRAGRAAEGKLRLQESERLQAQAIEDDRRGKTAAVLRLRAEGRMAERDYAGAVDIWRQAIALQPGSAAVHLRVAEALAAANRSDEAVAEYLTAISLKAGADAHRRLAELYDSLGRTGDAGRERAAHVERRLAELRQRAEQGAYGF
jgi:tetratricopeptide (TPR) repeat protein